MQTKRSKRSRIRAAKDTAGHGSKKKNRGAGHRGGRGKSGSGKRGDAKIMKITGGKKYLGKTGFTSQRGTVKAINLLTLEREVDNFIERGYAKKEKDTIIVDLGKAGYQKLISKGKARSKFLIKVNYATENAVKTVTAAGGSVETGKD